MEIEQERGPISGSHSGAANQPTARITAVGAVVVNGAKTLSISDAYLLPDACSSSGTQPGPTVQEAILTWIITKD